MSLNNTPQRKRTYQHYRVGLGAVEAPFSPLIADRVSAALCLAAVAISWPTAFAATPTRCVVSLNAAPTAFASRLTCSPKLSACIVRVDLAFRSALSVACAPISGKSANATATAGA